MSEQTAMELGKLVEQVKGAITATTARLQQAGLRVASFELNVELAAEENGGAKFEGGELIKLFVPFSLGGSTTNKSTRQFKMTFEVEPPKTNMSGTEMRAQLESALDVIYQVAQASRAGSDPNDPNARKLPTYKLKDSSIALKLGVTKEGKLTFLFDLGLKDESSNTVTLNLTSV